MPSLGDHDSMAVRQPWEGLTGCHGLVAYQSGRMVVPWAMISERPARPAWKASQMGVHERHDGGRRAA